MLLEDCFKWIMIAVQCFYYVVFECIPREVFVSMVKIAKEEIV